MSDLQLDWCSHEAAKYACNQWHYSECTPSGKTAKIGVWENDDFIGCILYSRATARRVNDQYGVGVDEICELTRVALDEHESHVSQMLSISLSLIEQKFPGLKLVVSYADPEQSHDGTVYQASNWLYHGQSSKDLYVKLDGEVRHPRTFYNKYGTQSIPKLKNIIGENRVEGHWKEGKHKYVYPLDDGLRPKLEAMSQPYP